ncbi:MAG TPA: sugar phosphate isomerase/epimerase family protein [Candidatus Krumholzibacteriaceae bacterium]|nr:sugar phosphate isomerase/epimerase family protein [Candidatus Krumholzibacteriaceae bacterium]
MIGKSMVFYLSTHIERLEHELDLITREGFYPEVRMASTDALFKLSDSDLGRMREEIEKRAVSVFSHGPFFGLDIASMDRGISNYTRDCLIRGIEVTASLGGKIMVMHTGYMPYFSRGGRKHWFRNWGERIRPVVEEALKRDVTIALENTWDDKPEILLRLADIIPDYRFSICLDTGHINCFSRISFQGWWDKVGGRVEVLHLHDNDGLSDDHLPAGRGIFDFRKLAGKLSEIDKLPLLDLEVDFIGAEESRNYLERLLGEEGIK